ncbi:MAG: formate/nitrite transporter family protein [Desulfobacter postgatei]|uniref:formate/nitrite transporter family protein n=1 Tax=Desulfobacter postgatei TaxID=2293 RepID=UPI0023F0C6B9|nr:formate/nitrite transporter family protein [Desulfobacter postgatei]MDD4272522.1 formate/nitrite transporter family protein [Desulfobacter postgatei]
MKQREATMKNFLAPEELAPTLVSWGANKANKLILHLLLLGFLAGAYIGFAAHLATVVGTGAFGWIGLKKFFMGAVFSVGLMLVIIPGSELWTGNTMMTMALLDKKITLIQMVRNWFWVYIGNLLGSVFLAWMIVSQTGLMDGVFGATALQIATAKVTTEIAGSNHNLAYFFRAVGCNWLVCLAVLLAISAQEISGKILGIFFPIMAFVTAGFEHAIANMYFIPAGIFAKQLPFAVTGSAIDATLLTRLNWSSMWHSNLIAVTIGNFIGGGIFVGVVYWLVYLRKENSR